MSDWGTLSAFSRGATQFCFVSILPVCTELSVGSCSREDALVRGTLAGREEMRECDALVLWLLGGTGTSESSSFMVFPREIVLPSSSGNTTIVGLKVADGAFQLLDQSVSLELTRCKPRAAVELAALKEAVAEDRRRVVLTLCSVGISSQITS